MWAAKYGVNDIVDGEYFLMEELKFNLIVFHPYRPLQLYLAGAHTISRDYHPYTCTVEDTRAFTTPILQTKPLGESCSLGTRSLLWRVRG